MPQTRADVKEERGRGGRGHGESPPEAVRTPTLLTDAVVEKRGPASRRQDGPDCSGLAGSVCGAPTGGGQGVSGAHRGRLPSGSRGLLSQPGCRNWGWARWRGGLKREQKPTAGV